MYTGYAADRILAAESEYAHAHEGLWKLETKEIHEKTCEFRTKFINELTARDGNAEYSEIKSRVFEALDRIYGFSKTDNGIGQQVSNTNNNQQSEVNMCNIKVIVKDGRASVFTPFNRDFVAAIRNVGGRKWDADDKCWTVPEESLPQVRQIMMDIYGETDLPGTCGSVTVKVAFREEYSERGDDVILFKKVIASARGRDSGARPGDDVTFLEGEPTSGGSMKNWESVVPAGCVVLLRHVPLSVWEQDKDSEYYLAEIVDEGKDVKCKELEEEKARLLARIAEIDKELAAE